MSKDLCHRSGALMDTPSEYTISFHKLCSVSQSGIAVVEFF